MAAVLAGIAAPGARAQTSVNWDADGLGTVDGGAGIWNTSSPRWSPDTGTNRAIWNNGNLDTAVFGGTPGVVHVTDSITANSLVFSASNYLLIRGSSTATITLSTGVVDTGANRLDVLPVISGNAGLTKRGSGAFVFYGVNDYTGFTYVEEGTMALGNTVFANLPSIDTRVNAGATIDLGFTGGAFSDSIGSLNNGSNGGGSIKLGTLTGLGVNTGSSLTVGQNALSGTFSGNISGGGRFSKQGAGTQILDGNNTYTGITNVGITTTGRLFSDSGGTLIAAGGSAIGDLSSVFMEGSGTNISTLIIAANETIGSLNDSALARSGTSTLVILNGDLTLGKDNRNAVFEGVVSGSGRLIKTGTGTQAFGSTNSTWTGGLTVNGGLFIGTLDGRFGQAPGTATPGAIVLDGGGIGNQTGTNLSLNSNRGINVGTNGGFIEAIGNTTTITYGGIIAGTGKLTKSGAGILTLSANNTFSGGLVVNNGLITSTRAVATATNNNPFGTGSIDISGAGMALVPAAGALDVTLALAGGAADSKLTYGPGTLWRLGRNTNTSLTVTVGNAAAAANSAFVRGTGGTLVLQPIGGIVEFGSNVGTRILVNGGIPTLPVNNGANTVISPSVVSTTDDANTAGEFVNYDATAGIVKATYSSATDLNAANNTTLFEAVAPHTLTADGGTFGLVNRGQTIDGAFKLSIGNGSGAATVVMNGGKIATGELAFGDADAVIYAASNNTNEIAAPITGTKGFTKIGAGELTLTAAGNAYAGATTVSQGILTIGTGAFLPAGRPLVMQSGARLNLNGSTQVVGTLNGNSTSSTIDLGASGSLTVGAGTSTYMGVITGLGASTLIKDGPGVLTLGQVNGIGLLSQNPSAVLSYQQLVVKNGGTVSIGATGSVPVASSTAIVLDNGTLRDTTLSTQLMTSGTASSFGMTGRGLVLNDGGGTIEVTDPNEIFLFNSTNLISGTGNLIKTGPGFFRPGNGNTYTGKTILRGGLMQPSTTAPDDGLGIVPPAPGADPNAVIPDQLIFDGGGLTASNTYTPNSRRGITVTANGGYLNVTTLITLNAPITGPGALTKLGSSILLLAGDNSTFTGGFTLTNGRTEFLTNTAAGSATTTLTLEPRFPVLISKTSIATDTVLPNPVMLKAGSTIEFRVEATNGALELAGKVSGPNGIFKNNGQNANSVLPGLGTMVLSNAGNDYTGYTVITAGTMIAAANNAFGAPVAGTYVGPGATLGFRGGINYSTAEPLSVSGVGLTATTGAIQNIGGANRFAGPITLAGDTTVGVAADSLELAGKITGAAAVSKIGPGKLTLSGAGSTWTGDTNVQEGALDFASNHRIGKLNLAAGTTASLTPGNKLLRTTGVNFTAPFAPDAKLDLNDGRLIIDYGAADFSPLLIVRAQIIASFMSAPAWTGNGITSANAAANSSKVGVGYAEASQVAPLGDWVGEPVDATAVLVRTTLLGDADLDGKVGFPDLVAVAQHYDDNSGTAVWSIGDFNYDGNVGFPDLVAVAQNYDGTFLPGSAVPGASAEFNRDLAAAFAAVPEPGTLSFVGLAGAALCSRRRRRK